MNKDFSNWLVASDVDGTLNSKMRKLPKRNYDAINRFVNELGGNFTLASGRGIESIRKYYMKLPIGTKVPAVIINGAAVYDFGREELVYFNPIGETGRKFAEYIFEKYPSSEFEVVTPEKNYFVRDRYFAPFMRIDDGLGYERLKNFPSVPFGRWGKVIMMGPPGVIKKIQAEAKALNDEKLTFMSSSIVSFEMLGENANKGTAVLKVAEMLGIDQAHTAAIGDYFNDYAMLKAVGLPACCGQAPKGMHEIASFHACHCNKGAVADLLEHIEKNY